MNLIEFFLYECSNLKIVYLRNFNSLNATKYFNFFLNVNNLKFVVNNKSNIQNILNNTPFSRNVIEGKKSQDIKYTIEIKIKENNFNETIKYVRNFIKKLSQIKIMINQ